MLTLKKFKPNKFNKKSISVKIVASRSMGFGRPRHNRPHHRKLHQKQGHLALYLRPKWRHKPRWLYLRRYSKRNLAKQDFFKHPRYQQRRRDCGLLPLFRQYRFSSSVRASDSFHTRCKLVSAQRFAARTPWSYVQTRLVKTRAHGIGARLQQFLISRIQPIFRRGRTRQLRSAQVATRAMLLSYPDTRLSVARRLAYFSTRLSARFAAKSARKTTVLLSSRTTPERGAQASLRKLRTLPLALTGFAQLRAQGQASQLSSTAARALSRRIYRYSIRKVTGWVALNCKKCSNCKVGKRCKRAKRKLFRRGRRGYAGKFGKLRYRASRRDRRLIRRSVRRLATRRRLLARSILVQTALHRSKFAQIRLIRGTRSTLVLAGSPATPLLSRVEQLTQKKARISLYQRLLRSSRLRIDVNKNAVQRAKYSAISEFKFDAATVGGRNLLPSSILYKYSFIARPSRPVLRSRVVFAQGNFTTWRKKKTLAERVLYSKRPLFRLPFTTASRRRRRKGGLGTFVQHSLRQPQAVAAQQTFLFAPVNALSVLQRRNSRVFRADPRNLLRTRQREDMFPRHWGRLPKRVDLKPLFWVSRGVRARVRQSRLRRLQTHYRRKKLKASGPKRAYQMAAMRLLASLPSSASSCATVHLARTQRDLASTAATVALLLSRRNRRRARAQNVTQRLLRSALQSISTKRLSALWQARSARTMQQLERALIAWSPQYQVRWRRWAYPRQDGVLLRRSWPSRRELRDRARVNAALSSRHRPRQKHWDRAPAQLQYYLGSINSVGYDRLRRSHRLHSRFARWWKPVSRPVPFAHPISRRALNAKRYYQQAFTAVRTPATSNIFSQRTRGRLHADRMERHMPSRLIPWRNFNYPAPRRGAPAVIQRWTMRSTGRSNLSRLVTKTKKRKLTLSRQARELRTLEQATSHSLVWSNNRWRGLDKKTQPPLGARQFPSLFKLVPASAWAALKRSAGSISRHAVFQQILLSSYRQWSNKVPTFFTSTQATTYLIRLITLMVASPEEFVGTLPTTLLADQLQQSRSTALTQKIFRKQDLFWRYREFPELQKMSAPKHGLLRRENSVLYKHWLHGAERFLKRTQTGYSPTSRSRYSPNRAKDFGRRRLRFPASGRRQHSYDSMLHAFAKRVGPAQFRRASVLRFAWPRPLITKDFRENLITTSADARLKRQRFLAQHLNSVSTLSAAWRELYAYRASNLTSTNRLLCNTQIFTKRRFAPLPGNALFAAALYSNLDAHRTLPCTLRVLRSSILRRALRRRRRERSFIDLRAAALQRRAPRERALRPGKLKRRARMRRAARSRRWQRPRERKRSPNWGLSYLSVKMTRSSNRATVARKIAPSGELLQLVGHELRRDCRALRGFSIITTKRRRRLRRKLRDSVKGRRNRRRRRFLTPLGAMLWKTHWSEGRELTRLRRLGARSLKLFVRKFIRPIPRMFHALYARRAHAVKMSPSLASNVYVFNTARTSVNAGKRQLPGTDTLYATSSLRRMRCRWNFWLKNWRLEHKQLKVARFTPVLRRLIANYRGSTWRALQQQQSTAYVGRSFVTMQPEPRAIGPLYFQKSTAKIVKSEAAKKRELEANISSKEARYKFTAQYVQNLTFLIPELINYMLSRKLLQSDKKIQFNTAQYLIRNIYWSLRIYLNVDPFDTRFTLRDQSPATRVRMAKLMEDLSAEQVTKQPQRAALRCRLQPGRLIRVRNKLRFRGDWLRNFLPAQHALYLENADEYGLFLLKTRRITRLRYGSHGIATWKTTCPEIKHETRARQLLTLRYSRATPRFETMLQGTRRSPHTEFAPVVGSLNGHTNFFSRRFSTQTTKSASIVSKLLRQRQRLGSLETSTLSPFLLVAARYRVLPRVESRGRTSFVGAQRPSLSAPLLDLRAVRAKSPRSRQFLVRLSNTDYSLVDQLIALQSYRKILEKHALRGVPFQTRGHRRFSRKELSTGSNYILGRLRNTPGRRAAPYRLLSRQARRIKDIQLSSYRTFAARRVVFSSLQRGKQNLLTQKHGGEKLSHPAVQAHSALQRSTPVYYKRGLTLPFYAIVPKASFAVRIHAESAPWVLRRKQKLKSFLVRKVVSLQAFARTCTSHRQWSVRPVSAKTRIRRASFILATTPEYLATRLSRRRRAFRQLTHFAQTSCAPRRIKKAYTALKRLMSKELKVSCQKFRASALSIRKRQSTYRTTLKLYASSATEVKNYKMFVRKAHARSVADAFRVLELPSTAGAGHKRGFARVYGGAVFSTINDLTELCATQTRIAQQATFDTYRSRLWNRLTLRRAKRERVARYWIKETGRWMRDPWIADIVNLEMRSKPGLLAGELRAREQQVGEYVPGVDSSGRDIPLGEEDVKLSASTKLRAQFRERHEYSPRAQPKLTEIARVKRAQKRGVLKHFVHQRLKISKVLRKKPVPMMWLANYEYNDYWKEFKVQKAKSYEEKAEEVKARAKENASRAARGLAPVRTRRYALKMPPLPVLPKLIWKEIHRRVRKLEWRESDEVFFRRGFRGAFRFYPKERNRAPWLETLMYTRATFSTRLREFRRRSFPREQKKYKWLQRVRKFLFPSRGTRYIKNRKWRQLRMYNQRLHYSLFNLPDRNAARRHFRKWNRRSRPQISSFIDATRGLGNRVDVTLMHLKVAPSIFWARVVAPFGLLRVNGQLIKDPAYRLRPSDTIHLEWDRISRFQHFFEPSLSRRETYKRRTRRSTSSYPTNFEYHRGTRTLVYKHAADESNLRRSDRISAKYFRWFKLDSV